MRQAGRAGPGDAQELHPRGQALAAAQRILVLPRDRHGADRLFVSHELRGGNAAPQRHARAQERRGIHRAQPGGAGEVPGPPGGPLRRPSQLRRHTAVERL